MAKNIKMLDESNFSKEIESGVTLIDFFAEWCGPCRMLAPVVEEVAETLKDKASFGKVDIDKQVKLATEYQVTSIPTLVLFKNGKEVDRIVGLRDEKALKEFVEKALK
ncbi:MAG: Thioredoxin [Candidatus Anoxychlamydiales bacterium]|uniref:Thioredoxin domain-containing protein n=1 Tax=marine sediment metagenome TaxID=412755 RepID=A0A0F9NN96_9ZZZZ|nr:Thioredoxin [Candidatus Anoxychlamydiales bacterium]NGX40353.1 Thioredoxin [Candidatus Anoxychlamydiales bacterium]HEU64468.1 thioredoxin [Chlamydiota bacterium]